MRTTVITGGAGFIGINLAHALARAGRRVVVYDNLSRPGVERNLAWLRSSGLPRVSFIRGDIRDARGLARAVRGATAVYHLAAQVAVTTSVADPVEDFSVNAAGTLSVLEACRKHAPGAAFLFASTNKVYGELEAVPLRETRLRYRFAGPVRGVPETAPLDFHSPYGCSKGCADQYVRDYRRIYGLRTIVFRQSCIYGPHQYGTEDQGWIAHFIIRALRGEPLTVYGDGKQVRDALHVSDLIAAYRAAERSAARLAGGIFNIGGGAANAVSLLEFLALLERILGARVARTFSDWRPGDQKIFVSDNTALTRATGWRPRVPVAGGVAGLVAWMRTNLPGGATAGRGRS